MLASVSWGVRGVSSSVRRSRPTSSHFVVLLLSPARSARACSPASGRAVMHWFGARGARSRARRAADRGASRRAHRGARRAAARLVGDATSRVPLLRGTVCARRGRRCGRHPQPRQRAARARAGDARADAARRPALAPRARQRRLRRTRRSRSSGFVVLFLHDEHGLSERDAALVIAVSQVLAVGIRIGIGRWSDVIGSRIGPLRQVGVVVAVSLGVVVCACGRAAWLLVPATRCRRCVCRWPGTRLRSRSPPRSPDGRSGAAIGIPADGAVRDRDRRPDCLRGDRLGHVVGDRVSARCARAARRAVGAEASAGSLGSSLRKSGIRGAVSARAKIPEGVRFAAASQALGLYAPLVRILERLDELYAIGGGPGANRPHGSAAEDEAHRLAASWCEEAGLEVEVDRHGNLFGHVPGSGPETRPVWTGSHLDTVPRGGRFDGALGVVAAIEAVERSAPAPSSSFAARRSVASGAEHSLLRVGCCRAHSSSFTSSKARGLRTEPLRSESSRRSWATRVRSSSSTERPDTREPRRWRAATTHSSRRPSAFSRSAMPHWASRTPWRRWVSSTSSPAPAT